MSPRRTGRALEATAPHVLRDYALLADGERGALVGPRGDVAWMCFPSWDSPAVFPALLGGAGTYAVTPRGRFVWGGYYEPATLIWRSHWVTETGTVESCEALAMPGRPEEAVMMRRVKAVAGPARLEVVLSPRPEFGSEAVRSWRRDGEGRWRGRAGDVLLLWEGAPDARSRADGHGGRMLHLELDLQPGEHRDLVLTLALAGSAPEPKAHDVERMWSGVRAQWRERVPSFDHTAAPRDCAQGYAVLSGMTGAGTVAAATTSLPERAREGRSYDYRYVWIRDQCYIGQAVARAGAEGLLDASVAFVAERLLSDGPDLTPAYRSDGGPIPEESHVDLPGYPGGSDVTGNRVCDQFQLDAFGEALLLFACAGERDRLDADGWRAAQVAARAIEERWCESGLDAGIWELEPDDWTHSRLICAAGLRALAALPAAGGLAADWIALADRIVAETATRALHPSGRWQRTPGDARVDASLLMGAVRGAVGAEDPRTIATLRAVRDELTDDGYCYRFKPDERPLGEAEGAFLLCGFWMSLALRPAGGAPRGGALVRARTERLRAAGAVRRGVRRRPAPAARQHPAGVRARAADRSRRGARRARRRRPAHRGRDPCHGALRCSARCEPPTASRCSSRRGARWAARRSARRSRGRSRSRACWACASSPRRRCSHAGTGSACCWRAWPSTPRTGRRCSCCAPSPLAAAGSRQAPPRAPRCLQDGGSPRRGLRPEFSRAADREPNERRTGSQRAPPRPARHGAGGGR